MSYDSATWLAFAAVLTALGAVLTWVSWKRRGVASATRALAWTLLPMAAWATGTLKLAVQVGSAAVTWATRLVFSPTFWAGAVLAGIAVVLFGTSAAMKARGMGQRDPAVTKKAPKKPRREVGKSSQHPPGSGPAATGDAGLDDDIEAILKRRGIS